MRPEPGNPFKGLAYFSEQDSASFGGRDRDVRAVSSGILKNRIFVLHGRSGLGKTSLLRAGIFPELARHACRTVYVRALVDPLGDLHCALVEQLAGEPGRDFHQLIDAADNEGPVVVVFDQFEEFFLRFPGGRSDRKGQRRQEFLETLGRLADAADLNFRLVFSLREDWVACLQDLERFLPGIFEGVYRLQPLTAFGVRQSILQAVKAGGASFDPRLVSALVEELAEVQFDPAVFQVVCSEVWKQARLRTPAGEQVRMTLADMESVGGVRGIFQNYLKQVARELPAHDTDLQIRTRAVLDALITEHGTKRAVPLSFFADAPFAIAPEELERVLSLLERHRLVRREQRGEETWYELVHERLIPTIREWLDADEDFWRFRAAGNLLESSCSNLAWEDNPGLLLSREQLDLTIGPFRRLLRLTEDQKLFLLSSAIYCGSKELEAWAAVAGDEVSMEQVERFLRDEENAAARLGAVKAAGQMPAQREAFAGPLLEMAIQDPDREVRHAAARSFARLAGPEEYELLRPQLRINAQYPRTGRVLAELVDRGLPPDHPFAFWQVRYARWTLRRQQLDRAEFALRGRRSRGLATGAVAGFLWSLLPGSILLRLFVAELFPLLPTADQMTAASAMGLSLLFTIPFGALIGRLAADVEARRSLLRRQEGRRGSSLGSPALYVGIVGPAVGLIALHFLLGPETLAALPGGLGERLHPQWALLALALLVPNWAMLLLYLGGLERLMRGQLFRLAPHRGRLIAYVWLWALGGSLFLPSLVWSMVDASTIFAPLERSAGGWSMSAGTWVEAILIASLNLLSIVGGLVLFVGCLAIVRSSPAWGESFPEDFRLAGGDVVPSQSPVGRWVGRLGGILLTAGAGVFLFSSVSYDSLLLAVPEVTLRGDQPVEFHPRFHKGAFDTEWLKVEVEGERPRLVSVEGLPDSMRLYQSEVGQVSAAQMLVLPAGSSRLAIQRGLDSTAVKNDVHLKLIPEAGAEESPLRLVVDDWRPTVVRLDYVESAGEWRGTTAGSTPGGPADEGRQLSLQVSPVVCNLSPALRSGPGFSLAVRGVKLADPLRCAETLLWSDFVSVPFSGSVAGEFRLDLTLQLQGTTPGEAEPLYLFVRLGWYGRRPQSVFATALQTGPCDPADPACQEQLREDLEASRRQVVWLEEEITRLTTEKERVSRQVLLDTLAREALARQLAADGRRLETASRQELETIDSDLQQSRARLEIQLEKLQFERLQREKTARLQKTEVPDVAPLPEAQEPAPAPDQELEALRQRQAELRGRPEFQLEVALRRLAVDKDLAERRDQLREEKEKVRQLAEVLAGVGQAPEDGSPPV